MIYKVQGKLVEANKLIRKSIELQPNVANEYLNLAAKLLPKEPFNENTWDEWTTAIKNNTEKKGKEIFMP